MKLKLSKLNKRQRRLAAIIVLGLGLVLALILAPRALRPQQQPPAADEATGLFGAELPTTAAVTASVQPQGSGQLAKEETIYAALNWDGTLDQAWAVNYFRPRQDWQIVDYGDYSSLTELTPGGSLQYQAGQVTALAAAGDFYYQGQLDKISLPWRIEVSYRLDGQAVQRAEDLAGASGWLELEMSFSRADAADAAAAVFYDNYALQISFTLPSEHISSLQADQATVATVGGDKTLSYIIFAGAEQRVSIAWAAQVDDFEMAGASIAALPLSLDLEQADFNTDQLSGDLQQLADGIVELDDGVAELDDGAAELSEGAHELAEGAHELADGVFELYNGGSELSDGAHQLADGLDAADDGASELVDGVDELRDGASELVDGGQLLADSGAQLAAGSQQFLQGLQAQAVSQETFAQLQAEAVQAQAAVEAATAAYLQAEVGFQVTQQTLLAQVQQNLLTQDIADGMIGEAKAARDAAYVALGTASQGAQQATTQLMQAAGGLAVAEVAAAYVDLNDGLRQFSDGLTAYSEGLPDLYDGIDRLYDGVDEFSDGASRLAEGAAELARGVDEYRDGVSELLSGAAQLSDATRLLADGLDEYHDGIGELYAGTSELRDETSGMDQQMQDKLDELLQRYGGADFQPRSFVSDQNEQVRAVQFVLTTPAVSKAAAAAPTPLEPDAQTLWQGMQGKLNQLWGKFFQQ